MTTLDTLYRRALIRAIVSTLAFAAVVITVLLMSAPADAQTVPQWEHLNQKCQGGSASAATDAACAERQRVASALQKRGYVQGAHDVWYSSAQRYEFVNALTAAALENSMGYTPASVKASLVAAYKRARASMDDAQMIAIWNDVGAQIAQYQPTAAEFGHTIVMTLQSVYAPQNDPRYTVDEQ
jgi:hypothetical protein